MGRPFESLISEANGFISRRNAIALLAMTAGTIAVLQTAQAAGPASVQSSKPVEAVAGQVEINGIAIIIEAGFTPADIELAFITASGQLFNASKISTDYLTIEAKNPGVTLTFSGDTATLAALGFVAGDIEPGGSPAGYRPFSAGDGDTPGIKVAVLMADASEGEEAVFIHYHAEVKAAKIVVPDAARAEAIEVLESAPHFIFVRD